MSKVAFFKTCLLIFLNTSFVLAQNGPGGVGNKNGTNSQPKNIFWLDASSLSLNNNDAVSIWTDKSGNGNDAIQTTASQQPKFITNIINSKPVIRFDNTGGVGNQDFMTYDGNIITNTDLTVIFVAARRSLGNKYVLAGNDNEADKNLHMPWKNNTMGICNHYGNDIDNKTLIAGNNVANVFSIFSDRLGSTESAPQRRFFQDGTELGNVSNANKLISYNGAAIARNSFDDGATYSYHDVDVAEIIFFTSALNTAQQTLVNNYLNAKYGMTIANDKYSNASGYNIDVAGIGKESDGDHLLGGSAGLYLQSNTGLDNGEYLISGHSSILNDLPVTTDLPTGTEERWKRDWYIQKSGNHNDKIIFDFPEGINGGLYPSIISNYVLLYRATTSGNYVQITTTSVNYGEADQVVFEVNDANLVNGYYTLGTKDKSNSPVIGKPGNTWYSLVSGNWDDPSIWTLDPAGSLPNNPDNVYPSLLSDKVVIKDGRTVTLNISNISCDQLTVEGRLDVGNSTGDKFTTIRGNGIILMAGDNFPSGDATHFITKGQGEGTVEYYGNSRTINTTNSFFNVKLNLTNASDILTLTKDITINGDFNIQNGIFKINNDVSTNILNINVAGNITVNNTGGISVGLGNTIGAYSIPSNMPASGLYHSIFHQFNIGGNFTNNGIVRFTNQTNYLFNAFTTTGAVTVRFTGASDALANLNGITDFYNLIIDKGIDQTYILEINSSSYSNFNLFGPNSVGRTGNAENPEVRKALWIKNGTLKLAGNIFIPSLTEGSDAGGNGDYAIGANAQLWIAGSGVNIICTADNTDHPIAGAVGISNNGSNQALSVYGTYKISNGNFNSGYSAGFIFWNSSTSSAEIDIDGGITDVSVFRSSSTGAGKTSYIQTGGTLIVRGDELERGEVDGTFPLFGLIETPSTFRMSGGDIFIKDVSTTGTNSYYNNGFYINSAPENTSVTGGKITISTNSSHSPNIDLFSTADLWNLDIIRSSGTLTTKVKLSSNINIQNDLYIHSFGELSASNFDVKIGENFVIETNGIYTPGANTTLFTESKTGSFTNGGTINPKLNNLTINKPSAVVNIGSPITCNGTLSIIAGSLNDGGNTITVNEDINNSGIHYGSGKILLTGAGTLSGIIINTSGNYTAPPTMSIAPPTSGTTAIATPILDGHINSIIITNGGSGYSGTPTITFSSPQSGTTATGTVNISGGVITGITITNAGSGYQTDPTFTLGNLGGGNGAILTLQMSYPVVGVSILNPGSGYTIAPVVTFSAGTPAANGTATIYTKHVLTGNGNGQLGNIELDETNGLITSILSANQQINGNLTMTNGILDLDIYNLNLVGNINPNTLSSYSVSKMIRTAGNNSDGGLTRYINSNNTYIYPLGTNANSDNRFSPALMTVTSFSDDGNLTIRPVDRILSTTLSTGGNIISFYWRTNNTNFTIKPNVTYKFNYNYNDLDGALNETSFVPGKVLEVTPFTRSYINNVNKVIEATHEIDFDNISFPIEDASYTAGTTSRFVGTPTVFYLRNNGDWRSNIWSYTRGGALCGNYPKAGDIAVIRRLSVSYSGLVSVSNAENAARVVFDDENGFSSGCPRVIFTNNASYNSSFDVVEVAATHQGGLLNGTTHGAVIQYYLDGSYSGQFPAGDFNLFNRYINALVIYTNNAPAGTIVPLSASVTEYPQIWTDPGVSGNYMRFPATNITIHGMTIIPYGNQLLVSNGAGNITFEKQLYLGWPMGGTPGGKLLFSGNSSTNNTVTVMGDIALSDGPSQLGIYNAIGGGKTHTLIAKGNIILNNNNNVFNLGDGNTANTNVVLELQGNTNNSFTNPNSASVYFYRIVMNKGNSQANNFTFSTNFSLTSASNLTLKPIELQNGLLILDNPNIDIMLSSGNGNFNIPSTSGLVVLQGKARITGANTGISLDGLLKIDNTGQVLLDGGLGIDNFIEYSSSGDATIQVGGNGILTVGSQIRRGTISTSGILKYSQTGGSVLIGKNAAPISQRGVFEVLNYGSDFTFTGGTLTICRNQTNPTIASLYLDPQTSNVSLGTVINIGDGTNTPSAQTIGIFSNIPLSTIIINSFHNPTAKLWVVPLTLNGDLNINSGASFNANGLTLTCNGNFTNNGTFVANTNTTIFGSASTQTITGNTNFYNLIKPNANNLQLNSGNTAIDIDNVLTVSGGNLIDNGNTIYIQGDCEFNGIHQHSGTGKGIMFNGTTNQVLTGSGSFGLITISNNAGVKVPNGNQLSITNELRMEKGVLNIDKNLLILGVNCVITPASPFSVNNMIQTNISFTDNGVKKYLPVGSSTFTYPMGSSGKYTPVSINITSNTTPGGSLTVKPADEYHPSVVDPNNVLHYYWVLKASSLTNFSADVKMKYLPSDVYVTGSNSIYDYITARLLNDGTGNWNKFDISGVNEPTNELIFSFSSTNDAGISGEYTAGIDVAIPNQVASYISKQNGLWTDINTWDTYPIAGGIIPAGGPRGSITYIKNTVTIPSNYISSYQTNLYSTGVINAGSTYGHRLGYVSGNGKIVQETGILPAGVYDDFLSANKGTLEFTGNTDYDILSDITSLNNIILSGTGERRFSNHDVQILGYFYLQGADVINEYNTTISVKGDIDFSNGSFTANLGKIILNGTSLQTISGTSSFTGTNAFSSFEINNNTGANLMNNVYISNKLYLTQGLLNLDNGKILTITNKNNNVIVGGSIISYVNGKMAKIAFSNDGFVFPIGNAAQYKRIEIIDASTGTTWTAQYLGNNPNSTIETTPAQEITSVSMVDRWSLGCPVSATGKVKLYWNSFSGVGNDNSKYPNLRVAMEDASNKWISEGQSAYSGIDGTFGTVTSNYVSFSNHFFTFASTVNSTPLPIELLDFSAYAQEEKVKIIWSTASEINNDYFDIERSTDDKNFFKIKTINAVGNSNEIINYQCIDNSPLSGTSYYRLKQVDIDGKYTYSKVVSVNFNNDITENQQNLVVYPNPTSGQIYIEIPKDKTNGILNIIDNKGITVKKINLVEFNQKIDISDLTVGPYILIYYTKDTFMNQKIIKL